MEDVFADILSRLSEDFVAAVSKKYREDINTVSISVKTGRSSGQDFESPKFLEVLIIPKTPTSSFSVDTCFFSSRHLLPSTIKHDCSSSPTYITSL